MRYNSRIRMLLEFGFWRLWPEVAPRRNLNVTILFDASHLYQEVYSNLTCGKNELGDATPFPSFHT